MDGGFNSDGTAWLSPEGVKFLAKNYADNKWENLSFIERNFDSETVELFKVYLKRRNVGMGKSAAREKTDK